MKEYPKIESLFVRDDRNKKKLIVGALRRPEFTMIPLWDIEEKVDGTNIRIMRKEDKTIEFGGRTESAQLPAHLISYLMATFTPDKFETFDDKEVTLYGEGYGTKIQEPMGSAYNPEAASFVLFDVRIGHLWLERDSVRALAISLGISSCPPIGTMTIADAVEYVGSAPNSQCSIKDQPIEGVIARPSPISLLDRFGHRVMWKLKVGDL